MPLSIEVPEELLQAIKLPAEEVPIRLKRGFAAHLYARGLLTNVPYTPCGDVIKALP